MSGAKATLYDILEESEHEITPRNEESNRIQDNPNDMEA